MNNVNVKKVTEKATILALLVVALFGAALSVAAPAPRNEADPWENVNRNIYEFNDTLDTAVVRPVASTYQRVVPGFARSGITNFFNNLDEVNVIVNDVLQLKLDQAAQDSGRFLLNSTIGLAGLIDVASEVGLYKNHEDFGQTLGYWGVESGPYVVLPFLGTSTVRDTIGMIPDTFFNPIFWVTDSKTKHGLYAIERIDTRVYYFLADSLVEGEDEYSFVRDALLQRREYLVADGEVYDEFDDY